ncbi:MAG TPA: selenocysteine-specific translation elongation factor [Candidatus Ruania gallistercoris]|uniref:Selenocysteine-specific translation elongation factor n=1 Tax=Candidatus Ruania gallistercoris TaxID=2838746 RepID=A0A9D2J5P8_9MICO|nr:selenocysteine-specific translation elongation factor [Candidatus Ruania gallistercoris]
MTQPTGHYVVATAGHVDHGKSALVRALTGIEPDRLAEERRRGLTVDLGFAWTSLVPGTEVAFVDVPGHERFLGNMLAGLGPAPVVCFVVAADEGWQAQSSDHRDAVAALGIDRGVLVLSRADRADPARTEDVLGQARTELAGTGLADAPAVVTSAVTGSGLAELREVLTGVLAGAAGPDPDDRVRLWLDRSFTIAGAGTVVTGTLAAGTIRRGDRLIAAGAGDPLAVTVRGLQSRGEDGEQIAPWNRVAVNLRGVEPEQVGRGDALLTPQAWPTTVAVDVRRGSGDPFGTSLVEVNVHVGTAALVGRLRPFDGEHARITFAHPLPVVLGDRIVLRSPGSRRVRAGVVVLDADPPSLVRRGDGRRRARALSTRRAVGLSEPAAAPDLLAEVARRGAVRSGRLAELGLIRPGTPAPPEIVAVGDWWMHPAAACRWQEQLTELVDGQHDRDPLAAGLSRGAAVDTLGLPSETLLDAVVAATGLEERGGYLARPGHRQDLGPAEEAVAELATRLRAEPFRAPEAADLQTLGLSARELAAAERAGRLLRLPGEIVLLPDAPAQAMRSLAALPQPFTASAAKKALGTTRRVVIPLLEHLDARGWTRRLDAAQREVVHH